MKTPTPHSDILTLPMHHLIDKINNKEISSQELLEIQPHIPLNNFLNYGDFIFSSNFVSAFSGGAGGGTGNQNYSLKFHYGLSNYSLLSLIGAYLIHYLY